MTKEEAIENHRKMWRWIAEKTLERGMPMKKVYYMREHDIHQEPLCQCYLCEYARAITDAEHPTWDSYCRCGYCPLEWPTVHRDKTCPCLDYEDGLYARWERLTTSFAYDASGREQKRKLEQVAGLAAEIAELPEKK